MAWGKDSGAARGKAVMAKCGYATGGMPMRGGAGHEDAKEDRAMIKSMVKPSALEGRARGGNVKPKHHTSVNVIVAPQGGGGAQPRPMPVPVPVRVPVGAVPPGGVGGPGPGGMPPGGPMGGPPPGMIPPGAGGPPMMRARGGAATSSGNAKMEPKNRVPDNKDMFLERTEAKKGGAIKRAAGGNVGPHMDAGAGGAKGRLEKIRAYGGGHR